MDKTIALSARQLDVSIGKASILHGVNLELSRGRWVSVVGPNGAGKSTLLRALAGLLPARSGRVELLGRELHAWGRRERAQALAWLGQNEAGADDLRVYDVVMLGRLPHQGFLQPASGADHQAVHDALRATQAWDWRERALSQLSGGERQRVLLARALAVQARVLLMDEPLANLDPPHQADWMHSARRLAGAGTCVVSVLHEVGVALAADELVVMRAGRVVHHGACALAATQRAVEQVFDGRIAVHSLAGQWVALPH